MGIRQYAFKTYFIAQTVLEIILKIKIGEKKLENTLFKKSAFTVFLIILSGFLVFFIPLRPKTPRSYRGDEGERGCPEVSRGEIYLPQEDEGIKTAATGDKERKIFRYSAALPQGDFIFNREQSESLRKLEINDTTIGVEIAANQEQKIRGLSGKNYLPAEQGMLFTYNEPKKISIWMKDMRFAVDIIWINENFKIIHIENDVQPDSFPKIFSSQEPAQYVLEVNAGFAEKNNIKIGDEIKVR